MTTVAHGAGGTRAVGVADVATEAHGVGGVGAVAGTRGVGGGAGEEGSSAADMVDATSGTHEVPVPAVCGEVSAAGSSPGRQAVSQDGRLDRGGIRPVVTRSRDGPVRSPGP